MHFSILKDKILKNKIKICIIGLGYVGFPLLQLLEKKNIKCIGIDQNKNKIKEFRSRKKLNAFFTTDYKFIREADIIIYSLPTPLDKKNNPDLKILRDSINKSKKLFKNGQLIILESTSYPGTTKECLSDVIKKFKIGTNFFIGYSPERIDPGNKFFNIENTTKITSGYSNNCQIITNLFFKKICKKVVKATSIETAEFTKIYENIFRSVNIGLANETKQIAKKLNIDFNEIVDLAATKLFGFMKFIPGPGVGGHCIAVDPFYLSWLAKKKGIKANFIELSGKINSNMPNLIINEIGLYIKKNINKINPKILVLGMAYKKNIGDIRNSPSLEIFLKLKKISNIVKFQDNFINSFKHKKNFFTSIKLLDYKVLKKFDAIILATDHDYYDSKLILKYSGLIFDLRNKFKTNKKVIKL